MSTEMSDIDNPRSTDANGVLEYLTRIFIWTLRLSVFTLMVVGAIVTLLILCVDGYSDRLERAIYFIFSDQAH